MCGAGTCLTVRLNSSQAIATSERYAVKLPSLRVLTVVSQYAQIVGWNVAVSLSVNSATTTSIGVLTFLRILVYPFLRYSNNWLNSNVDAKLLVFWLQVCHYAFIEGG